LGDRQEQRLDFGRVGFLVGLLAGHAEDLREPYTRHLGGKVVRRSMSVPPISTGW